MPSSYTNAQDKHVANSGGAIFFTARAAQGGKIRACPGQCVHTRPSLDRRSTCGTGHGRSGSDAGHGRCGIRNLRPAAAVRHVYVPRQSGAEPFGRRPDSKAP